MSPVTQALFSIAGIIVIVVQATWQIMETRGMRATVTEMRDRLLTIEVEHRANHRKD